MVDKLEMTKLEAVQELSQFDHCFLNPIGVEAIGKSFGFYRVGTRIVNSKAFKGLSVEGLADGDQVDGMDAADLAEELCKSEGISYPTLNGRGSRLRFCCQALKNHLTQ